jgi:cyanophycinase
LLQYPDCGAIALVGSGEYLPVMSVLESELLQSAVNLGKRKVYVQIPTAAAKEGNDRLDFWASLGQEQADRLGAQCQSLPIFTRSDAFLPANIDAIHDAGLIYFSGGDPHYLAETLIETPVWRAIVTAWGKGSSLAGCSAGAMVLGKQIIGLRKNHAAPGLNLLPNIQTIPHYNRFLGWLPDRVAATILQAPDSLHLIGIDEETALVRDGADMPWRVWGEGKVHMLKGAPAQSFSHGEKIAL